MTVGVVTSYSSATQYQYFGTAMSTENIRTLMEEYGVSSTGNATDDLKNLYKAMYVKASANATSAVNQSNSSSQLGNQVTGALTTSNNVPWATLMSQVGLNATGNLATDYSSFKNLISEMQVGSVSQQDKASINQLEAEASIVFVQQGQSATQGTSGSTSAPRTLTGADIQAAMNKMLILG